MLDLNVGEIGKLKKGELAGTVALCLAGFACVALIVLFSVAIARDDGGLRIYAAGICIPALCVFSLIAAICNLKYGKALDRIIKNYIRDIFIGNASLMHPERDGITYYISCEGTDFFVKTNNFKERITFDFSAFGRVSAMRRAKIISAIIERLCATFCRLVERGVKFKSVSYSVFKGEKQGNTVYIIENGAPDKKTYKNYLKQK